MSLLCQLMSFICRSCAGHTVEHLESTIEVYNIDIVKNWGEVLRIIQGATVLFNMIDYGDYFDLAAQSYCLKSGIPFIQGGTYSQCVNVEFFAPGRPCLGCGSDYDREIIQRFTPDKILTLTELSFLPKNQNPVGLSNTYLCGTCAMMMTAKFGEYLLNRGSQEIVISNRTIFYVNSMEAVNFNIEIKAGCVLCDLQHEVLI